MNILEKNCRLEDKVKVFNKQNASRKLIAENGKKFSFIIYGAPITEDSVNNYRYLCFAKSVRENDSAKLNSLSHMAAAFGVYFQIQTWLGHKLNLKDWGWGETVRGNCHGQSRLNAEPNKDVVKKENEKIDGLEESETVSDEFLGEAEKEQGQEKLNFEESQKQRILHVGDVE